MLDDDYLEFIETCKKLRAWEFERDNLRPRSPAYMAADRIYNELLEKSKALGSKLRNRARPLANSEHSPTPFGKW